MTSDLTATWASFRPHAAADGRGAWVCSDPRLAGRLLDRNSAITAMTLAEHEAAGNGGDVFAAGWKAELRIT